MGDFNGDGKPDLAVLDVPVCILLGNGDGTFQSPIFATLPNQAFPVAVADFNGDKKADLVVNFFDTSGTPAGAAILFGNGDGTFKAPKTVTGQAIVFTIGDFDGDGKTDLVVPAGVSAQILLGHGDGTFSPGGQAIPQSGYTVGDVWAADLNGDDRADLMMYSSDSPTVSNKCGFFHDQTCTTTTHHVSVFLSGNGSAFGKEQVFGSAYTVTGCYLCFSTVLLYRGVGDFDGDGKPDIAATQGVALNPTFTISLGGGDGSFGDPIALLDPGPIIVAADLNGDKLGDLIVLDPANNNVSVLLNATPAFSMIASSSALTASAGEQVSDTLSLTPLNGFSSAIQLSCQVTGPAPAPTCSLSPASIAGGASSSTSTLTISMPAPSAGLVSPQSRSGPPLSALALPFAFVGLGFRRKLYPRYKRWLLGASMATAALILMCTACGGGSGSTQSVHQPLSYTVQVTAASDALTKTMQISLTVQ